MAGGPRTRRHPERCARCGVDTGEPVMIAAVETGSGPGAIVYACPPCARAYARTPLAPEWLRQELAEGGGGPE